MNSYWIQAWDVNVNTCISFLINKQGRIKMKFYHSAYTTRLQKCSCILLESLMTGVKEGDNRPIGPHSNMEYIIYNLKKIIQETMVKCFVLTYLWRIFVLSLVSIIVFGTYTHLFSFTFFVKSPILSTTPKVLNFKLLNLNKVCWLLEMLGTFFFFFFLESKYCNQGMTLWYLHPYKDLILSFKSDSIRQPIFSSVKTLA